MNARLGHSALKPAILLAIFAWLPLAEAQAQERPAPVLELAGGALFFPDDGTVTEGFVGGAFRFHLSPRLSVGPELAYISGEHHSHLMLTGNLTVDLIAPASGGASPVTPFLVVGGGLFRTNERFPQEDFSHNEGAFTAGGGVRARVGNRLTLGAEARIGWELHVRVNGMIGVRLGG